jgi:CO/xanthine dehydrogenase Mo-binding subunit
VVVVTWYDMAASAHPAGLREARVVGRSVLRLEDPPLLTGAGRYVGDLSFPHQLHMRVVRSAYAHGRIVEIDTAAAAATPGVVAVWTSRNIAELPPIGLREGLGTATADLARLTPYLQPVLARERVRYVGEPVAAVFAEDPYLAEDAADLVDVQVEELPVLLAAIDAPGELSPGHDTEADIIRKGYGDLERAFAGAHQVIELDLTIGRHSGSPIETRGALARYDRAADVVELHGAAKIPHVTRDLLARTLGRDPGSVHLHEGHVGGGFGIRGELYPEDVLVALAALRLGSPVKWIEDRREHLMAANHSRQQRHHIRAAVDREGRILAIDDTFFHDQGAYLRTHGTRVADLTAGMLPGPYRAPAYRVTGHVRLTNKTPAATYRAPGRYEGTFVRERLMDAIAAKLGIDPVEVRRRNLITSAEMPYQRPLDAIGDEVVYDSGDYAGLMDKALAAVGWDGVQEGLRQRRAAGEAVGAGLAIFVEKSGLGPTDRVTTSVDNDGVVEVVTGGASVGQGFETIMAQIAADALGVDYRRVRVVHGHTDRIERGVGAHASRATVMTGSATHIAARALRERALEAAAGLMQLPVSALDLVDGKVIRRDMPDGPSMELGEISRNSPGGLHAEGRHTTEHMNYPYGVHVAVVRVDRATGGVDIERYLTAYDIGRAVNPMLVEGQIAGGFAQGVGGALSEEFRYDERGEPLSATFADYLMPTAREIPRLEMIITEDAPSPLNPLGLKGAGEAGVNGVGAALAAAIDEAVGIPGAVTGVPVTPQRLKEILDRHRPLDAQLIRAPAGCVARGSAAKLPLRLRLPKTPRRAPHRPPDLVEDNIDLDDVQAFAGRIGRPSPASGAAGIRSAEHDMASPLG